MSRFIDEHRGCFGVEPICRTLDVSASAYYQRATGQRSDRVVEDERLLARIEELHAANYYAYGYRRMWKALGRAGEQVGRDHVKRLMGTHGIQGAKRRGKPWRTTIPDLRAHRSPDLVQRDFTASRPDALWVADFTYLRCWEGLVFFAFVIDVFSRRVVGWQFAGHMRTDLVLDALRMALARRRAGADVELIHHSDAGSQYTSYAFTQVLDDHAVLASIGDAYDNALAESFVDSSRPSSSPTASGRPERSLSWRSSSTSAGSTTTAYTSLSTIVRQQRWRPSTPASTFPLPHSINEKREPPNPVSAEPSPAQNAAFQAARSPPNREETRLIPSLAAISRGGTPSAANARTYAHSTALRTSCALPSESTTTPIPAVEREPDTTRPSGALFRS